jgi:hypothetical protein
MRTHRGGSSLPYQTHSHRQIRAPSRSANITLCSQYLPSAGEGSRASSPPSLRRSMVAVYSVAYAALHCNNSYADTWASTSRPTGSRAADGNRRTPAVWPRASAAINDAQPGRASGPARVARPGTPIGQPRPRRDIRPSRHPQETELRRKPLFPVGRLAGRGECVLCDEPDQVHVVL